MIVPEHRSREFGLYRKLEDGTVENIAMPVWHWGKFYERIVRNICQGIDTEAMKGKKAVNYWWGLSADVIDVICTQNMPHIIFWHYAFSFLLPLLPLRAIAVKA